MKSKLSFLLVFTMICSLFIFTGVQPAFAATTYEVGPGFAYPNIGDVPWESLNPGDIVNIHWKSTPYYEKWVINQQGTSAAPITVRGIPGPNGELPVIDGNGATTRLALDFPSEGRGVIKFGKSNIPVNTEPMYIVIESLEVRGAKGGNTFYDDNGAVATYSDNAAAIFLETGDHITFRNCIFNGCGNGFFTFYGDKYKCSSSDILVEGCYIHGNGNVGSIYEHNIYSESLGITYQYNRLGPMGTGCSGNNLKDRSAGLVVRYNWLEGGNRQLDLVHAEDSRTLQNDPLYRKTYVYGNILIELDDSDKGNPQMIHYGGDMGSAGTYRKGTMYLYNNTFISKRTDNKTTLMRLSTDDETCDARNNIFYVTGSGILSLVDQDGVINLSHNWLKTGYNIAYTSVSCVVNDDGTNITGTSPGFVNEASGDYHLAAGSACIDAGGALNPDVLPAYDVLREYVQHQSSTARASQPPIDIGAFEY